MDARHRAARDRVICVIRVSGSVWASLCFRVRADTFPVSRHQKTTFGLKQTCLVSLHAVPRLASVKKGRGGGGLPEGKGSPSLSASWSKQAQPEQMEDPEEAEAATQVVSLLMQSVYLTPGDHDVDVKARRIDHAEACNAVGAIFDILHSNAVQSTLVPWFDGNTLKMDSVDFFPGALLMGRLFSFVARVIALKHQAADGSLVPVEIDAVSYARLNDDTHYMRDLAVAITRKGSDGVAVWSVEAEAYHMSRGVEAFFRGCLSVNVDDSSVDPTVYFMGSISGPRNLFCSGFSGQSKALFSQQSTPFNYYMHPGARDPGQPVRINKPVGNQSKETRLAYVRAHIWNVKAYFDKRLRPTRKRHRASGMAAAAVKAGRSGRSSNTAAELDDELNKQQAAQGIRAQAATTMTAPHKAVQVSTSGIQSFDIYADTPLSEATYDRYVVEQQRLENRLKSLVKQTHGYSHYRFEVPPFVHDVTPMETVANKKIIQERDKPSSAAHAESRKLLSLYTTTETIPIYINIGSDHSLSLNVAHMNDVHATNMKFLSRIFREVRRMTTLMYLLWDKESGEEIKRAKERVSPKESFIRLLNAGKDNNGFVFNSSGYAQESAVNDESFTIENAKIICKNLNVIPFEQSDEERVNRTMLRVPKLWSSGMETIEDTARVVAQYAHASAHEVGARVGGAYLFHRSAMFDRKIFDQWNLLYATNVVSYDAADIALVRKYLKAKARQAQQNQQTSALALFEAWLDELRDTDDDDDGPFEEGVDVLKKQDSLADFEACDALIKLSRRHWSVKEKDVPTKATSIYQAVRAFRLWRRDNVLKKNRHLVANAQSPSSKDNVDQKWFTDTFGISPGAYDERTSACGGRSNVILTPKEMPAGKYAIDSNGDNKSWGVMFVNELMLYEFGDTSGYTPENSVMHKVQSVYSSSSVGVNGIATAKEQFKIVEPQLDSVWNLLAKMSSVGILNLDSHLGNYMITEYKTDAGLKKMYAKVIDFDPSYTTVFTKEDLIGSNDDNPNREGWKPLYVLNVLMVLYTLSQDPSRAKLYLLLKNANRVQVDDTVYGDGSIYALKTGREDHFKGIVAETIRALARTPVEQMSVPQRLLAASWRGGFKGTGDPTDLGLPTAFFSNGEIRNALMYIAQKSNDNLKSYAFPPSGLETDAAVGAAIKVLRRQSGITSVEPLSDADIDEAIKVLIRLDKDTRTSNRQAPKVPAKGATHLSQMEWAMRHNLFTRSFMDPAEFICRQWSRRQELVYSTLDRTKMVDASDWKIKQITPTFMSQLLAQMTPMSAREFHSINLLFDHDYKRVFAPGMYHCATSRAEGYRVIDLLYDYVFSPTFGKPMGDGKSHTELLPRKPDLNTKYGNVEVSQWKTWPTHVPSDGRGVLSLPPAFKSSPSSVDGEGLVE